VKKPAKFQTTVFINHEDTAQITTSGLLNPPWRNRSNSRLQFQSTSFYVPERPCITTRSPSQLKSGSRQTWAVQWAKDQNGKFCIVLLKLVFVKSKIQHEMMFTWNCHNQIFNTSLWELVTLNQFELLINSIWSCNVLHWKVERFGLVSGPFLSCMDLQVDVPSSTSALLQIKMWGRV